MGTRHARILTTAGGVAALALLLSGCAGAISERAKTTPAGVVTVEGPLTGTDAALLEKSWAAWEKTSGITIKYTGSADFESQIALEAQQGNAPDLAIFAQPGIIGDLASRGYLQPLPTTVSANVTKNFPADWAKYTTTGGVNYAAPLTASVNGWVFYSPQQFYSLGISIPSTWSQLLADTKTIQAKTGKAPWCDGFSEGGESGSAGVSWVDDLVLRLDGTTVYDGWVNHTIPFTDPRITLAFNAAAKVLLNNSYINAGLGGAGGINTTTTADVATSLEDGACAMTHQPSSFVADLTGPDGAPANVSATGDFWAFPLPPVTASTVPLTGGGDFVSAFSRNADTVKVQQYLSSSAWATARVKLGGMVSPDIHIAASSQTSPLLQEATNLLHNQSAIFRFDAADLMPAVVGSGTFLTGMVDWAGGASTKKVQKTINLSWPH